MTVSTTTTPRIQYSGSGSTGPFSVPYVFVDDTDLTVIKTDSSGVDTTLTITTHYTVSGGGTPPASGSITLVTALAVGETLTIVRNTARTQEVDYVENDNFSAETHEGALDKLTLLMQELNLSSDRAVTLADSSSLSSVTLPAPGASELIRWNSAGTALETVGVAALDAATAGTGISISSGVISIDLTAGTGIDITGSTISCTFEVADDTTPQLGGDLDLNGHVITGMEIGTDIQAYDAELAALAGLTSAANKVPYFTGSGTAGLLDFVDEDTMSSDSATAIPSQQSVKAYVDTEVAGASGDWVKISTVNASGASSADFTDLSSTYAAYKIIYTDLTNSVDSIELYIRTSTDNGSTFDSSASDYAYVNGQVTTSGISAVTGSTGSNVLRINSSNGNATNETHSGEVTIFDPSNTSYTNIVFNTHMTDTGGAPRNQFGSGRRKSTTAVDAVRIFPSSGTITGTFTLYGIKA
tara:strand:+ start:196 stop:1605 length:1410 start_codon:yes stop_codon:yes gene_type:complete